MRVADRRFPFREFPSKFLNGVAGTGILRAPFFRQPLCSALSLLLTSTRKTRISDPTFQAPERNHGTPADCVVNENLRSSFQALIEARSGSAELGDFLSTKFFPRFCPTEHMRSFLPCITASWLASLVSCRLSAPACVARTFLSARQDREHLREMCNQSPLVRQFWLASLAWSNSREP